MLLLQSKGLWVSDVLLQKTIQRFASNKPYHVTLWSPPSSSIDFIFYRADSVTSPQRPPSNCNYPPNRLHLNFINWRRLIIICEWKRRREKNERNDSERFVHILPVFFLPRNRKHRFSLVYLLFCECNDYFQLLRRFFFAFSLHAWLSRCCAVADDRSCQFSLAKFSRYSN